MKNLIVLDIEVLPNYFLVAIKGLKSGRTLLIDMFGESTTLTKENKSKLNTILRANTSFGFNSIKYDMPLLNYALSGASCNMIYKTSKDIIEKNQPHFITYRNLNLRERAYDHFDISEPAPAVMISLKNYGTRIGSKKLQDFYLDPHNPINVDEVAPLRTYCLNDLEVTIDLYESIKNRIELRLNMSKQYGLDLRSKSDAQIAETVLVSELLKLGVNVIKPDIPISYKPTYNAPDYISFETQELNELLEVVNTTQFSLLSNGAIKMPKELSNKKIKIGNTIYKMGIGGLHSQEKSMVVESNDEFVMRNADFTSYYPFIIIVNNLYPKQFGKKFLDVYGKIVEDRLVSKKRMKEIKAELKTNKSLELEKEYLQHELIADSLKICINGSFGKLGSKYSKLYSPDLLLATTLTGQLTLLMLIEQMELNGISVVSANTDGIEYYCPKDKTNLALSIIFDLELVSGYNMENDEYKALYARDVNNYVAVYDGYVKAKGMYGKTSLKKGLSTPIVYEAVREYLLDGTPIEDTISLCKDINEFASARTVKGGGVYNESYLGKMVRWIYDTRSVDCIKYKLNGNKVPKTDSAYPMMDIFEEVPKTLNYKWYFDEAIEALKNLGVDYEIR